MPRKQDFSQSVIYHIRSIETKQVIYVGSTTQFTQRKSKHKHSCNTEKHKDFNRPVYCYIRDNGGFNNFEVLPITFLNLENKTQLFIEEQNEIDKHSDLKNRYKSYSTEEQTKERIQRKTKEWRENNKDNLKNYREKNEESLKEYRKEYRKNHLEQIKKYREENIDKIRKYHREYAQENKEKLNEKLKEYRDSHRDERKKQIKEWKILNKDKIREQEKKLLEKIICPICNSSSSKINLKRHQQSKKCKEFNQNDFSSETA